MVKHLVEDRKLSRFAVFYQYDAYGLDGLTGAELALNNYGLEPVAHGSYIRGTMDVEDALESIMASNAAPRARSIQATRCGEAAASAAAWLM